MHRCIRIGRSTTSQRGSAQYRAPSGESIHITCTACDLSPDRLTTPHCDTCGRRRMVCVPAVLVERARGTQLSITAVHPHYRCPICDADELNKPQAGHLPNAVGGHRVADRDRRPVSQPVRSQPGG